jgi:hypothetical protein
MQIFAANDFKAGQVRKAVKASGLDASKMKEFRRLFMEYGHAIHDRRISFRKCEKNSVAEKNAHTFGDAVGEALVAHPEMHHAMKRLDRKTEKSSRRADIGCMVTGFFVTIAAMCAVPQGSELQNLSTAARALFVGIIFGAAAAIDLGLYLVARHFKKAHDKAYKLCDSASMMKYYAEERMRGQHAASEAGTESK